MEEQRLDRFILRHIGEFEADDDPVTAPLGDTAMEVAFIETVGHAEQVLIEKQPDRPKQVCLAGPVLADDRVDALFKLHRRSGKVSVIDHLEFRYVHGSPGFEFVA